MRRLTLRAGFALTACTVAVAMGSVMAAPDPAVAAVVTPASPAPLSVVPTPTHTWSVTGQGVSTYPSPSPAVHHYGIRTTGATGGAVTVTATTSDTSGHVTVDGSTPDANGHVALTGLAAGQQVSVKYDDALGITIDTLIYLPSDFPELVATTTGSPQTGDVLVNVGGYATAIDQNAVPVFLMANVGGADFKRQPNGHYSTVVPAASQTAGYTIAELDATFHQVSSHSALAPLVNTDSHDSILEPNGNQVTISYEPSGSQTDAVIQEADSIGHVLFSWNSHDHGFAVADAYVIGSAPLADYMHINSIQITPEGDFLASFRNLSAVVKIARTAHDGFAAGDVIWQLGGKHNQFTFVGDALDGPCAQHTAYELPNGHITIFDDGARADATLGSETADMCPDPTAQDPNTTRIARPHSRAVEYAINETTHTATLVWSYDPPDIYTAFAGSTQRLANGDTLIDWAFNGNSGTSIPIATEVDAAKNIVWQLTTPGFVFSYRAFKFASNDAQAPSVVIQTPTEGGTYPLGAHVSAAFTCSDSGGSLLQTCQGSVRHDTPIDTSTPGAHTITVTATDHAGNHVTVVRHYLVSTVAGLQLTGDFNGDGRTDIAVWRPSNGGWYMRGQTPVTFGRSGDIPVPADFNGDGRTDIAVWRPSTGTWYVRGRSPITFGRSGDIPVPADFTGAGRAEIAVWRPSNGTWYILGHTSVAYGRSGDIPVPVKFDNASHADIAVWRPSNGTWYVRGHSSVAYGRSGDVPVPGDYNHDGRSEIAVWRPSNGTWYVRGRASVVYGRSGDVPVIGDYNHDGTTDMAVWRPGNGTWYVRGNTAVAYGRLGDIPV